MAKTHTNAPGATIYRQDLKPPESDEQTQTRALSVPNTVDLDTVASSILGKAREMVISSTEENEFAAGFLRGIQDMKIKIVERFEPAKKAAHEAHKKICEMEMEHIKPLKDAEAIVKKIISSWMVGQEMKRVKAQEKENVKAEAKGLVPKVIEAPKPDGISMREVWSAKVTDLAALVRAVANLQQPIILIEANQKALDNVAKALKGEMRIPGVEAVKTNSIAARRS